MIEELSKMENIMHAVLPFWRGDTVYHETVMPVRVNGEILLALMLPALSIVSVTDSFGERTLSEGRDFTFCGNYIRVNRGVQMNCLSPEQLYGANLPEGISTMDTSPLCRSDRIIFTETDYFMRMQYKVTYRYANADWKGPRQSCLGECFEHTLCKLRSRTPVSVLLYGDSISAGAHCSKNFKIPPYQPEFGELFTTGLSKRFNSQVAYRNTAVGGMLSDWGAEHVQENVVCYHPDLTLIGFGMNDASWQKTEEWFEDNIETMIKAIRQDNEKSEILLIGTIVPNPESAQNRDQTKYLKCLKRLGAKYGGIGVVDMGAFSQEVLKTKKFIDISGNNVNHPNDFLMGLYAMNLYAAFVADGEDGTTTDTVGGEKNESGNL